MLKPVPDIFLHPRQVRNLIKQAELEGEVVVIRCVRKTDASKDGGPNKGELYDLHCGTKPEGYKPSKNRIRDRDKEDQNSGTLTVFVTNRKDPDTDTWGAWRRVNLNQVQKVIYRTKEIEVKITDNMTESIPKVPAMSSVQINRIKQYNRLLKVKGSKRVYARKGNNFGFMVGGAAPYTGDAGYSERVKVLWNDGKITTCTLKGMKPYRGIHEKII